MKDEKQNRILIGTTLFTKESNGKVYRWFVTNSYDTHFAVIAQKPNDNGLHEKRVYLYEDLRKEIFTSSIEIDNARKLKEIIVNPKHNIGVCSICSNEVTTKGISFKIKNQNNISLNICDHCLGHLAGTFNLAKRAKVKTYLSYNPFSVIDENEMMGFSEEEYCTAREQNVKEEK